MADRTANEDFGGTTMSRDEEIKEVSLRIAQHSAQKDQWGDWWGDDTNLGRLTERIEAELSVFKESIRLSTLEEVQREMRLLITKWRNDPSEGKFSKEMETFNTYLGFIIQKVNERIEELKQRGVKT